MRRSSVISLMLAVAAASAACAGPPGSASPVASATAAASEVRTLPPATNSPEETVVERVPLPSAFPVFEGAAAEALPDDDLGLIALWSTDQLGSSPYDFYVTALPSAGYPIIGLYPGGEVALIRFSGPGGPIWQMVARGGSTGRLAIEIRLDRP